MNDVGLFVNDGYRALKPGRAGEAGAGHGHSHPVKFCSSQKIAGAAGLPRATDREGGSARLETSRPVHVVVEIILAAVQHCRGAR